MGQNVLALSIDEQVRMYGLANGVGHAVWIPADMMSDPLATGGVLATPCGGKGVDSERITEKFTGDRMCARCTKFIESTQGTLAIEGAITAMHAREAEAVALADLIGDHTLITLDGVREVKGSETREDSAPETREITPQEVREIIRESKGAQRKARRAAAVANERERLAARAAAACKGTGERPVPGSRVARDDHSVSLPDTFTGKCSGKCPAEGCGRIIAVSREGGMRRHNAPASGARDAGKREAAAPVASVAPATPVQGELWGKTQTEMRDAVAAHYAAGHAVPAEIVSLPDPKIIRPVWAGSAGAAEESSPVCDYRNGAPVDGSDADGIEGKCPECRGIVGLSDKGLIPGHRRYGVKVSGKTGLASKSLDAVEHGTVPGSPVDANKRRTAESRCVRSDKVARNVTEGGTKKCTGCGRTVELYKRTRTVKGEQKIQWVYPQHERPEGLDSFRAANSDAGYVRSERKVTPRGTGADAGKGAREHGTVNGSANTGRVNLPPVQPKEGWLATAGTGALSMTVRPGPDSKVVGEICPLCQERVDIAHRGKSRGWRRDHSKKVAAWHKGRNAARAEQREREIQEGKRLPAGARRAARKAASIGSFSEGTLATTGTVAHGGERPAVASRVKPRGKTRTAE